MVGGYYGLGNIGDEMMCRCIVEWIWEIDPEGSVGVLMAKGGKASRLWIPDEVIVHPFPEGGVGACRRLMSAVDVYIVGGGTCFHRFGVAGFYQNLTARLLGIEVLWIGIGADHLGSLKNRFKGLLTLSCAKAITVRDVESAEYINSLRRGLKTPVYPDLVFNYMNVQDWPMPENVNVNGDELVVAWRELTPYLDPEHLELLDCNAAKIIIKLAEKLGFSRVIVINTADAVDGEACSRLHEEIFRCGSNINLVLVNGVSLEEKLAWLGQAGAVISARLHPLMLATFANRPCFGLAYADKMNRFASLLRGALTEPLEQWLEDLNVVVDTALVALRQTPCYVRPLAELRSDARGHRKSLENINSTSLK